MTPMRLAWVFSNQYGINTRACGAIDAPMLTVVGDVKPSTFTPSKPMKGTPLDSRKGTRSGAIVTDVRPEAGERPEDEDEPDDAEPVPASPVADPGSVAPAPPAAAVSEPACWTDSDVDPWAFRTRASSSRVPHAAVTIARR